MILVVLFIWFLYPIAATGLIVVLWVINRKYKRKIRELSSLQREPMAQTAQTNPEPPQSPNAPKSPMTSPLSPIPTASPMPPAPAVSPILPTARPSSYPGTVALIMGVVFVVLAGLIFATTTWRVLPDLYKVIMVLAFALFFFADSFIAEKWLKIERTGRAFYILGSVFLFLAVLAVGYFKLLGPSFILEGRNRYWVLWTGSAVTECAFLIGFRSYKEKVYSYLYLIGLTVSVSFLTAALRGRWAGFLGGMVCYSFLLLACGWLNEQQEKRQGNGFLPEMAALIWPGFAMVQLAVFLIFLMPGTFLGFLAQDGGKWLSPYRITVWKVFCLGIGTAGMRLAVEMRETKNSGKAGAFSTVYNILLPVFFQYAAWGFGKNMEYRCLAGAVFSGAWFVLDWKKWNPFRIHKETMALTMAVFLNALFLFLRVLGEREHMETMLAALGSVLILSLVASLWSHTYPKVRRTFLYLFSAAAVLGGGVCVGYGIHGIRYDWILFACLFLTAAWDFIKKDIFLKDILLWGIILQLGTWRPGEGCPPFFLLLFFFLFLKSLDQEGKEQLWMRKAASLFLAAGVYCLLCLRLSDRVLEAMVIMGVLALEYALAAKWDWSRSETVFWEWMGSGAFLLLIWQYYWSAAAGGFYPLVCLAAFIVLYGWIYTGNSRFAGLPMAVSILFLPFYMGNRGFSGDAVYAFTAAIMVLGGMGLRYLGPVYEQSGDGKELLKIDWLMLLSVVVILPMICLGSRGWRFVYTLLLIPYALQFYCFLRLRRAVLTLVTAIMVAAWWLQPFGALPDRIWLEMELLPVVLFAAGLPFIWGKEGVVLAIQTIIGSFCLVLLAGEALISGDVRDAILLEAICLILFTAAYLAKCRRWVIVAGTMLMLMVLYMTKGFWLNLSWWIYLLAAGSGMIGFAAWYEKKNKGNK